MHLWVSAKDDNGLSNNAVIMLALFPKGPKIQRPKALKINVLDYPTVFWCPLSREPPANIHIKRICEKLYHWATSSPPFYLVWVYLHSNFHCKLRKIRMFCAMECTRNGCSRSSKVIDFGTNLKRIYNFLLVINSRLTLALFCPVSEILQPGFLLRTATPHLFHPNFGGVPLSLDCRRWSPRSEEWP